MRIVLLAVILSACTPGLSARSPTSHEKARVVKLECASGGWGSAFPVAREGRFSVLATAKHVSSGCELKNAVVWREHETADVALVLVDSRMQPFVLAKAKFGEQITSMGYPGDPGDGNLHLTRGTIAGRTAGGLLHVTAPLWFGFSGGPTFNDAGEVVCVNTAIYPLLDGWSMCTDIAFVEELLK